MFSSKNTLKYNLNHNPEHSLIIIIFLMESNHGPKGGMRFIPLREECVLFLFLKHFLLNWSSLPTHMMLMLRFITPSLYCIHASSFEICLKLIFFFFLSYIQSLISLALHPDRSYSFFNFLILDPSFLRFESINFFNRILSLNLTFFYWDMCMFDIISVF